MERQVNINNGEDFFAHETSIHFNPEQVVFDFKCITPRIDVRAKENAVLNLKHNIVMVNAWQAKRLLEILGNVIKDYEKKFGKIEKPKAIEKLEKMQKGQKKPAKIEAPNYFG